jgi:hypothetical protein
MRRSWLPRYEEGVAEVAAVGTVVSHVVPGILFSALGGAGPHLTVGGSVKAGGFSLLVEG